MSSSEQPVILYEVRQRVAYLTLNRPSRKNAITLDMPDLLATLVKKANADRSVHVLLLQGAGGNFSSGYDLKLYAEDKHAVNQQSDGKPWDPLLDYEFMGHFTECYMSLWRSMKPVVCKIEGFAIGGGSDIALCCDI